MRRVLNILVALLLASAVSAVAQDTGSAASHSADTVALHHAEEGVTALQRWYDPATGLYKTTGWWNSANALTVLIDYARAAQSSQYNFVVANTFVAAQNTNAGFLNQYYDDEGWWALAWIDAYDLTGNKVYLAMASSIFADMSGGWDSTCGGGIWWSKERRYKNAIANELFLSVAAHLANRDSVRSSQYLDWANREWKWFASTGMVNAQNVINDGLTISGSPGTAATCVNNGKTVWTYNQGVVLGGLVELSKLNPDPTLAQAAQKIATAAITQLADHDGILHDPCEPACGADGVQFKGIFVRNLISLYKRWPNPAYKSFIQANAQAIWDQGRGDDTEFSEVWSGPFHGSNAAAQSSALDAMIAAAILESAGI